MKLFFFYISSITREPMNDSECQLYNLVKKIEYFTNYSFRWTLAKYYKSIIEIEYLNSKTPLNQSHSTTSNYFAYFFFWTQLLLLFFFLTFGYSMYFFFLIITPRNCCLKLNAPRILILQNISNNKYKYFK